MIEPLSFSAGSETAVAYLGNLALKAAVLLSVIGCFDHLLGRRRPLARSALWHAALAALTILPLATLLLPPLSVQLYVLAPAAVTIASDLRPAPIAELTTRRVEHERHLRPAANTPAPDIVSAPVMNWRHFVAECGIAIYLFGCLALTWRLLASLRAVARLLATAEPVADERWQNALAHWQRQLGGTPSVRLLTSSKVSVPVQVGWLRPAILLPPRVAASCEECNQAAVLIHELGHVRRGDYGWNLLLRLLSILYWPHPLIWLAGRRVAQLREQACDELCIHWLGGASTYRAQLIELAAGLVLDRPLAALGMAMSQPTKLARRLQWIDTSSGRRHCILSALGRRSLIAAMFVLASMLGALTAARSIARAQEPRPSAVKEEKKAEAATETKKNPAVARDEASEKADGSKPATENEPEVPVGAEPVRVRVERVKRQDLTIETIQPCMLTAGRISIVHSRVPGYVKRMAVEIGDVVKKGDLLAELEAPEMGPEMAQAESTLAEGKAEEKRSGAFVDEVEADLAVAQADLEKTEAELEGADAKLNYQKKRFARVQDLVAQKAIGTLDLAEEEEKLSAAQAAYKAAKSSVASAKASVRQRQAAVVYARATAELSAARLRVAEAKLAGTRLRGEAVHVVSPIDGVIVERSANVGVHVGSTNNQHPLCTVADLERMLAAVNIPEIDALKVKRGAAASVSLNVIPGKHFAAKVRSVGYNIDPATRSLPVELELDPDQSERPLLANAFGIAAVALETHRDVLVAPRNAFWVQSNVVTVVDGRAKLTPVERRGQSREYFEIVSGLQEGDLVITDLVDPKQPPPKWDQQPRIELVDGKGQD